MGISTKSNQPRRNDAPRNPSSLSLSSSSSSGGNGNGSGNGNASSSGNNNGSSSSSSNNNNNGKPTYQKVGNNSLKKIKFHSKSCEDASQQERIFRKLDAKNPQQAHKIHQRRKAIAKGKNTIGYDVYCRKIPREKRQKRSMITPSTPDHTLDMPNKKWNGLVRSWRVALHRYDPVDLQESFGKVREEEAETAERITHEKNTALSVKEQEIANSGLANLVQVQVTPDSASARGGGHHSLSRQLDFDSPPPTTTTISTSTTTSTMSVTTSERTEMHDHCMGTTTTTTMEAGILSELDRWEAARGQESEDEGFFSGGEDDDSDDDLL